LADGPVVHAAGTAALRAGASVEGVIDVGRAVSQRVPVATMCYANPILARGADRFAGALADAGIDGQIVPDLPDEEANGIRTACDAHGVDLIPLAAPTTPPERLKRIGEHARGFVYVVSLIGTTGERKALAEDLPEVIARAKEATDVPVAVGFGIATPEQAAETARSGADGVIVGSRLVREAAEAQDPVGAVKRLVEDLAAGLMPNA
jgi:tryptophan synthase alpha chain